MSDNTVANIRFVALGICRLAGRAAAKSAKAAAGYLGDKVQDAQRRRGPPSEQDWYLAAATSCEGVSDAILRDKSGTSERVVRAAAGKLGAIGVPAAIFSVAALIGTASTGTAIGSLSGAAFTSAALAWIGSSVAVGGIIVGVAAVAGGIGAAVGASWVARKALYGKKRDKAELVEQERRIVDACLVLALAFRNEDIAGRKIEPSAARALYRDALKPLCDDLLEYRITASTWPVLARKRLSDAIQKLESVTSFAAHICKSYPNLTTGIVGAVLTELLADDLPTFDTDEQLVLAALRRSNGALEEATNEELASYIQSLEPAELRGVSNNVLGIYHELRYAARENYDGDQYVVELFEATNHPGADVRVVNTITGEVKELQLKATSYLSYVKEHNERYGDIPVLTTEEVAAANDEIEGTGFAHKELREDIETVLGGLEDAHDPGVIASMSVAAMISLARNVSVLLKGANISDRERSKLVEDGVRSALICGLVHTVIG